MIHGNALCHQSTGNAGGVSWCPKIRQLPEWLLRHPLGRILIIKHWLHRIRTTMEVFSHYGIGINAYAIERKPDGRVEFTCWFTIFWIPVFPLSSWSAVYADPLSPDDIKH